MDDFELLRQYVRDGSQAAFTEIVRRNLDFVYTAALRQLRSSQSAEDVAQSVFLDLARNAERIRREAPLVAWLFTVTRRTAIDVVRQETRRQLCEKTAVEVSSMKTSPSSWELVEPVLDEALASLKEGDRAAILLRFFENKSLREIGARFGTSDDAAQKKVSRALDQLRRIFSKRGIALSAAGLAGDLSAHAVQSAPSALSATISAATSKVGALAFSNVAAVEASRTLAFSSLQKTAAVIAAAATVGLGLYQSVELRRFRDAIRASRQTIEQRSDDLAQLRKKRDQVALQSASKERERDALLADAKRDQEDATLVDEMHAWFNRAERLKQLATAHPELITPEIKLLDENTWFTLAKDIQLDSESHVLDAFAVLRQKADVVFTNKLMYAVNGYVEGNDGALPKNLTELLPFFESVIDPAILSRYELLQTGNVRDLSSNERMAIVGTKFPIDIERDFIFRVGTNSLIESDFLQYDIGEAQDAFAKANGGTRPKEPQQWIPFLKWPVSEEILTKRFGKHSKG